MSLRVVIGYLNNMPQSFKVGQAPWETQQPTSFAVGSAPWETQEEKDNTEPVGGFKSFIRGIAEKTLRLGATVPSLIEQTISTAGTALGQGDSEYIKGIDAQIQKQNTEGFDAGYFGKIKPLGIKGGSEGIKDAIGVGADVGSLIAGGGGGTKAVIQGLKGKVIQGIKEGAKIGSVAGGALSFGDALNEAENSPMDVAYSTVFGTTLGGLGGGVFGAATPLVAKGVSAAKSLTKVDVLEKKLSDGFKRIFNPTARQIKADTRFGNDSFEFLAKEMPDLPIEVNSAGRIEADNAIDMARMKYTAEATAYKPIIRNSGKYIDIDDTLASAKRAARAEFDGSDLEKAEQQIDDEVEAYLRKNPGDINVTADGRRYVTLSRADDIKSYSWSRGKGWGTPEAEVWNDTNNLIGHSLKDAIEKQLPDAPIKAMNRRLGQWKNAIDMLERRNGQVSGSGGRLSKLFSKQTGSIVGATIGAATDDSPIGGGLTGAGAGFMTATALASAMANPRVRLYAIRQLLNRLQKAGRGDMIEEAERIVAEQSKRYLLPAKGGSSYVEKAIELPTSVRETNLGLDEVRNMNQSSRVKNLSNSTESGQKINTANAEPPTTFNNQSNIDGTIPPNVNGGKVSRDISLKGEDAYIQEASIGKYEKNKEALLDEYVSTYGNIVNSDNAKKLFADVGYRGNNAAAVQEASSALAKDVYRHQLKVNPGTDAVIYAGGSGSGKSSALQQLGLADTKNAAAILDGNLSTLKSATARIEEAVNAGKYPKIVYVYRDQVDAWINGVIKRLDNPEEGGRIVPLRVFLENHKGSYDVVKKLIDDGLDVTLVDNSLGFNKAEKMSLDKFNKIKYDTDIKNVLLAKTKQLYDTRKITKEQYNSLIK
jgi:hypothetical protein